MRRRSLRPLVLLLALLLAGLSPVSPGLTHYDPYGVARPGSTATTGIGYAGEYRDGTGLINLRARSYDPVLGRFIGRDTYAGVASAPQTGNRYAYATANPLRNTDPSGHFVQTVIDNPYSVLEIAVTFTPVGALAVFGYQLLTGTDPATGAPADPTLAAIGVSAVIAAPIIQKLLLPAFAKLFKGLGGFVGKAILRGTEAGAGALEGEVALGTKASAFGEKLVAGGEGGGAGAISQHVNHAIDNGAIAGGQFRSLGAAAARDFDGGSVTVFRVEGRANARLRIDGSGNVSIQGRKMLFLNFSQAARARSFLERRLLQYEEPSVIKAFEVPTSYVQGLRDAAIPESLRRQFPELPISVDASAAPDQFGLPYELFGDLEQNIVPGSGRVVT